MHFQVGKVGFKSKESFCLWNSLPYIQDKMLGKKGGMS